MPHEDRRELRGYGVFAAWLNHVDAKAINSLDTLVTENGRSFVRHHLIDFGSTLGSGGVAPADYWAGSAVPARSRAPPGAGWSASASAARRGSTPRSTRRRRLGGCRRRTPTSTPTQWKPRVPNRAFLQARADDQFWAARKLTALRTDLLRAAVAAGEFGDPASEAFLVRTLAERRDAIARAYLTAVNPIADPALDRDGTLTFQNVAVDADVARAPQAYRASWFLFDNATGETTSPRRDDVALDHHRHARLPARARAGVYIKVQLRSVGAANPAWETPVDAYFRMVEGEWRLVGFERMPQA